MRIDRCKSKLLHATFSVQYKNFITIRIINFKSKCTWGELECCAFANWNMQTENIIKTSAFMLLSSPRISEKTEWKIHFEWKSSNFFFSACDDSSIDSFLRNEKSLFVYNKATCMLFLTQRDHLNQWFFRNGFEKIQKFLNAPNFWEIRVNF